MATEIATISRCSSESDMTSDMSDMQFLFQPGEKRAGFRRIGVSELGRRQDERHRAAEVRQREQAHTALSTAIEMYRAMEMTFWLPQAEAEVAGTD